MKKFKVKIEFDITSKSEEEVINHINELEHFIEIRFNRIDIEDKGELE